MSDFRYPGGTSASLVQEIAAQHRAGITTVMVHVPSPHLKQARGFHPGLASLIRSGAATLALPSDRVSARTLVIRQPRVFTDEPSTVPDVTADSVVMVANQPPRDRGTKRDYYDPRAVHERLSRLFGEPVWTPIGPLVRESLDEVEAGVPIMPDDWVNVIDVDEWWVDRPGVEGPTVTIGRFSRPDERKWPDDDDTLLAAYPDAPDIRVRVLGGGEMAVDRLGRHPANWELLPFGSVDPRHFVTTFDVFVYFHSTSLVEAFGRTVLESMASGTPAVLPWSFQPLFEGGAILAEPSEVAGIVRGLRDDPAAYRDESERATAFVRERFGHEVHVARVRNLLGEPASSPSTPAVAPAPRVRTARDGATRGTRLLMLSSNGGGLGHVSRLMAVARRLPDHVRPVIATQSQGAPIVRGEGFTTEYIPSRGYLRSTTQQWNTLLEYRLAHLLHEYDASAVIVDGTVPYGGLLAAMERRPDVRWIWLRRAMWREGLGGQWLRRGEAFDDVLEPGDYSAAADVGLTREEHDRAHRVGPITYLDANELVDRDEATDFLGLDTDRTTALLQLGAGNINDIASPVGKLAALLLDRDVQVVVARSPISRQEVVVPDGVRVVSVYPLSRYLRAFDFTISAGGYNSFHESISFAVPTIFVPNHQTALDDQALRVREAARRGLGLELEDLTADPTDVLDRILDPAVREALRRACDEASLSNGAHEAAAWLTERMVAPPQRSAAS